MLKIHVFYNNLSSLSVQANIVFIAAVILSSKCTHDLKLSLQFALALGDNQNQES